MSDATPSNHPAWQAESTYPELSDKLREKLREVRDPEIGMDVIQLGLIRDVKIEADKAEIKMLLTTIFCPYGPAMVQMVNEKAQEALGRPTHIDVGMEPWDMSMMEDGAMSDWGFF